MTAAMLLFPFSFAFECSFTSDPSYCAQVSSLGLNETEMDLLYASLLYETSGIPDHAKIQQYNLALSVSTPPYGTLYHSSHIIKDSWLSFLMVSPSVLEEGNLYVPKSITARSEYNYRLDIPKNYRSLGYPSTNAGDCQRNFRLVKNTATLQYLSNGNPVGTGKVTNITVSTGHLDAVLTIDAQLEVKHYRWKRYCCQFRKGSCVRYCYRCEYTHTDYPADSLRLTDRKKVTLYQKVSMGEVTISNSFYDLWRGNYTASDYSQLTVNFSNPYIRQQAKVYEVVFDKKPYYIAYLHASNFSDILTQHVQLSPPEFTVANTSHCEMTLWDHFAKKSISCDIELATPQQIAPVEKTFHLRIAIMILLLFLFLYLLLKALPPKWRISTLFLVSLPSVAAADCGFTNLGACLPQKFYEFLLFLINAPLAPMLFAVKSLLTANVSIDLFYHIWSILRYILSFFYVFLFMYAGFILVFSGGNYWSRIHAKGVLRDALIMTILIQGSFYLYELLLHLSSVMNSAVLHMIDPHFFLITIGSPIDIGLEVFLYFAYGLTLFLTMVSLAIRYVIVSFGVVFAPIGIFLFFFPPLRAYGRFILSVLGLFIFITFIDLLIILACSMLIESTIFVHLKILVMIVCFAIVNYTIWLCISFAKGLSVHSFADDIGQAVKFVATVI